MAAYERYFTLGDHVGIRADGGAPEPFVHLTVTVDRPTMNKQDQLVIVRESVKVGPIEKGSRSFKVTDPLVGQQIDLHMVSTGFAVEVEKPTKKALASERSDTQDAINQAGTTGEKEE
jgi:hypothetical protein